MSFPASTTNKEMAMWLLDRSSGGSTLDRCESSCSIDRLDESWYTQRSESRYSLTEISGEIHDIESRRERQGSLIKAASSLSPLQPQKRRSNSLSALTIDKLRLDSLGFHGRDPQIAILKSYFNSLVQASSERRLVLVSGTSGIGKTKLVDTFKSHASEQNGFYAKGKFDLKIQDKPYAGIADACAELCGHILGLQKWRAQEICNEIENSLQSELVLLARIIPPIGEIIQTDKSLATCSANNLSPASTSDSKNQVHFAFQRFLRVVSKHFDPFIMVLDDLQWADASSLELLEVAVSDVLNPKFMVVGIYRSNEVDEAHIFHKCLQELKTKSLEGNFLLNQLEVSDLDIEAVDRIIQDVLGCQGSSRTLPLAQICHKKTNGNPFYLLRYLQMLYSKHLLQFNFGTLSWIWDDAEIKSSSDTSENVVDILKEKMREFSSTLLKMLKLAACLGSTFEVNTLLLLWLKTEPSKECVDESFDDCLRLLELEGFMVRVDGSTPQYRWVHDNIHEAAIEMIPESKRAAWNFQVGETLLAELDEAKLDSSIFVVVNLLNAFDSRDLDVKGCMKLARLNYEACLHAVNVSAFESVANYAGKGIGLLPEDAWDKHYDLALQLYSLGAKAAGAIGNVATMERYCKAVLAQEDKPFEDKFDVYHTWIDSILNRSRARDAADKLFKILEKFNCRFPRNPVGVCTSLLANVLRIKATMKSRDPSTLPLMVDKTRIELMRFLDKLATTCYILKDNRFPLVIFRSLNWTMKYGVCDPSPPAFALAGMILTGILGDIQGGALYGQHALNLLKNKTSRASVSRTIFLVHAYLFCWTHPYRTQTKPLLHGYDIGLQTGDTESAIWGVFLYMTCQFHSGVPLQTIEADMFLYQKQMKDLKREQGVRLTKAMRQAVLNLMAQDNRDEPTRFTGESMSKEDVLESRRDPFWSGTVLNYHGLLFTYFGDHSQQADIMLQNGHDYLAKAHVSSPNVMPDYYLKGLSCFAMARKTRQRKYAKLGQICRRRIKRWLEMGNPNAKHYDSILDAEFLALKGHNFMAIKQYEVAILLAGRGGYQHDAALASERLGEFHLEVTKDLEEGYYRIKEAIKYWRSWGAVAKVEQLEKKHPDISSPQSLSTVSFLVRGK